MKRRAALAGVAAVTSVLATLASGCASHDEATPTTDASVRGSPDRRTLRPVSLPDLSRVATSVREQVGERNSSLMLKVENPGTTTLELGNAYGEMGNLFMAAEDLEAAESCYLNAQALMPSEVRWPYYLGHLYRTMGEPAKAAAFFERTLQLRPDDVATLVWLGSVYLDDQGRPEAAEPLFTKALSLQPRSVAALFGLGRAALARRDYARGVEHLEQALALDQRPSLIHYSLAMAYRGLGELGKAEEHLRQRGEVEIDPPDPLMRELGGLLQSGMAYEFRGIRAFDQGKWAEATANFGKGVELAPDKPSLRHRLGTALFLTGDARGAQEQFEEALRLSPQFAKAHYSLGVIMESAGRHQEAVERFTAAVRYEPTYVEARLQLADALRRSGRLEESLPHYEQVVKLDPRVAEGQFGYTIALVRLKRYSEARERLTEGMRILPDRLEFAHALARLLAAAPDDRVRDGRRAKEMTQELLKKARSIYLDETMAMTLAELGQYEEAVARQREAMAAAKRAGRDDLARRMAENLRLYERRQPCRTPVIDDDAVALRGQ